MDQNSFAFSEWKAEKKQWKTEKTGRHSTVSVKRKGQAQGEGLWRKIGLSKKTVAMAISSLSEQNESLRRSNVKRMKKKGNGEEKRRKGKTTL
jgi:hypothetical protein